MHPTTEQVFDLVDGSMDNGERGICEAHLQSCSECAAEFENCAMLIGRVRRPHLTPAPEDAVIAAKELFGTSKPLEIPSSLKQIVAEIVFDSFTRPVMAGVRSDLATPEQVVLRQIILQADEFDIHIRVSANDDHRDLLGQILPRGSREFVRNANLYLRLGEERIKSTNVNHLGEFQFSDVPDGLLSLQIDLPSATIISALGTMPRS